VSCLDEPGHAGGVSESLPDLGNLRLEHTFAEMQVAPETSEQVLALDQLPRLVQQVAQDSKSLRPERNQAVAMPQLLVRRVETKGRKQDRALVSLGGSVPSGFHRSGFLAARVKAYECQARSRIATGSQ
jgi:hypothetical protein